MDETLFAAGRQQIWGLLKQRVRLKKTSYVKSNYCITLITEWKDAEMFSDMTPSTITFTCNSLTDKRTRFN